MKWNPPEMKHRFYGRFAVVAALYTLGVVLFTAWAYFDHSRLLTERLDEKLSGALYACREIIDTDFLTRIKSTDNARSEDYRKSREKLSRYADLCQISALGAACYDGTNLTSVISVNGQNTNFTAPEIQYGKPLPDGIHSAVLEQIRRKPATPVTFEIRHPEFGHIRATLLYSEQTPKTGCVYFVIQHIDPLKQQLKHQVLRESLAGIFLLVLVIPLVILYNQTEQKNSRELSRLNARLQHDVSLQKEKAQELKDAINDLERFSSVAAGRESRVIELKKEVNELLDRLNEPPRYSAEKRTD